ncbi:MAG: glycosyltransferase [Actinobacteria bacterium]|nr:glycosyltransferase [Actinomycetota bacterium]
MTENIEETVKIYRINSLAVPFYRDFRFSIFVGISIKKIFREFKPDIVHLEDHLFVSRAALSEARRKNINIIATNHFTPYNWIPNLKIKKNSFIYIIVEKILWGYFLNVFNKINNVTVPSNFAKEILRKAGFKKNVVVISNGVDLKKFKIIRNKKDDTILKNTKSLFFLKHGIDTGKLIILSVSRLDSEKRIDRLINAISLIKDKIKLDFQFIIVGKGKEEENLKRLSRKKGMDNNTIFTGRVEEDDLLELYGESDIFISASDVELQGISIMEAMAAGLTVVAAHSMAIPELVQDGLNGYHFEQGNAKDAGDKILRLINNKKIRMEMGLKSELLIKQHDFEKTLDKFEEMYSRCLYYKSFR